MRVVKQAGCALVLFAIGYAFGAGAAFRPQVLNAQTEPAEQLGPQLERETIDKIKAAYSAMSLALNSLQQEQAYEPAMKGLNAFMVLSGGGDARADLEAGRGVDPETFAALYAGLAVDDLKPDLGTDEDGRMTYKGKVIRMYPISRLKQMFGDRARLTGQSN